MELGGKSPVIIDKTADLRLSARRIVFGKYSFQTFSHDKSVVRRLRWPDVPMRYQPYGRLKDALIRMFLH